MDDKYLVVKGNQGGEIIYFEYDKIEGINIKPKQNVKFKDAINVNKMIIVNPSLIEKMLNRKLKIKFDKLIKLVTYVFDTDDGDGYNEVLNEINKFKLELYTKYKEHLNEDRINLLTKKLSILEHETKTRILYMRENEEKEIGKGR